MMRESSHPRLLESKLATKTHTLSVKATRSEYSRIFMIQKETVMIVNKLSGTVVIHTAATKILVGRTNHRCGACPKVPSKSGSKPNCRIPLPILMRAYTTPMCLARSASTGMASFVRDTKRKLMKEEIDWQTTTSMHKACSTGNRRNRRLACCRSEEDLSVLESLEFASVSEVFPVGAN